MTEEIINEENTKSIKRSCETCANFSIETFYGVCCKNGALGHIIEGCKDYEEK